MGTNRFATLVRFDSRANLVCVQPEVSSDKGRDSAVLEAYLLAVLWQVCPCPVPDHGMACTSACTCTCTAPTPAPLPAIMRKAWSVDARKDQTHAAHRPTGSICGVAQAAPAGLAVFLRSPAMWKPWWVRTRDSKARSATLLWYSTGALTTTVPCFFRTARCRAPRAHADFGVVDMIASQKQCECYQYV